MSDNGTLKLVKIQNFLLKGRYAKAITIIKKETKQVKPDSDNYWKLILLCAIATESLGHYNESMKVVEKALTTSYVKNDISLQIDFLLVKCKILDSLGKIDDEATVISDIDNLMSKLSTKEKKSIKFKEQIALLYQMQGWYYLIKTKFNSAEEVLRISLKLFTELNANDQIAKVLYNLGSLAMRRGKSKEALPYLTKSLFLREQIGNPIEIGLSKKILGAYYRILRDNKKALENILESLEIFKKVNHKHHLANTFNSLGVTYLHMGDLALASEYFEKALEYLETVSHKRQLAYVLSNVGTVEKLRGNLDLALESFLNALEYFDEIGSIQNIGAQLLNVGDVYLRKGAYDKSLMFLKKALEYRRKTENTFHIARALYILIKIHSYINQKLDAREYFYELKEISLKEDNLMLKQLAMIAEAFLLKMDNRSKSRVLAEDLLIEVIRSEMTDFEIYLDAMLNLGELLVIELKVTSNQEVLIELRDLLSKINEIAKLQQSYWLLAEVYWIQSHLDLIDWDMDKAQRSFTQAQIIAEEKGFDNLAMRISQDYDNTFSQVEIWEQLREKNAPLVERIEAARLDELITKLKQQIIDVEELPSEQPVMLLILKQTGQPIYHRTFIEQVEPTNESLLSAFISSINIFFSEVFKTSGSIERIKHEDLTILFKSVNNLMFCYVFKGQSYTAIKKLDEFIFTLQTSYEDLWRIIVSHLKTTELLQEAPNLGIDEITDKVFLNGLNNSKGNSI